jgi:hypothetical protein
MRKILPSSLLRIARAVFSRLCSALLGVSLKIFLMNFGYRIR